MKSYWRDVKGECLVSAISMTNLEGLVVESSIVVGGELIYKKAVARSEAAKKKGRKARPKIRKTGVKEVDEVTDWVNQNPFEETLRMKEPSEQSHAAAKKYSMNVIGINSSAFFNTEAVMLTMEKLHINMNSTADNPIIVVMDGARPHITPEVRDLITTQYFLIST